MSQFYKGVTSGDLPPEVVLQFTTDVNGPAIPENNNLNLLARDTSDDDANGIRTNNDPDGEDDVYVELTNRLQGTGSRTGATTLDLITFDLGASAAVYRFYFDVAGRDTGTGDGVGYRIEGTAKTDGATASLVGTPYQDADEDASLSAGLIDLVVSGNNIILQPTGVAGQTISYSAVGYYVKV